MKSLEAHIYIDKNTQILKISIEIHLNSDFKSNMYKIRSNHNYLGELSLILENVLSKCNHIIGL